jgi:hypothetical protein
MVNRSLRSLPGERFRDRLSVSRLALAGPPLIFGAALRFRPICAIDKLKSLQLESSSSTPASYMYVYELPEADLERVELRGRSGIADGKAWVPLTTILDDTRKYWQFGASPPSGEILTQDWVRFFIPGLAVYHVRIARNCGQRLRDARRRVSLRIDAYAHLGPP